MCLTEYDEVETLKILANEARKEGYAKGYAEGYVEGYEEETLKQRRKTIQRMKEEGMSAHLISNIMEVSEKYVNSIG